MTKEQRKLLRFIYKKERLVTDIYKKFNIDYDSFTTLTNNVCNYIDFYKNSNYDKSVVSASESGRVFVEKENRESIRYWYPHIISTISLIVGTIALIRTF